MFDGLPGVHKAPRTLLVLITPIAMIAGFVHILFRDIGRAFKAAWLEAGIELDAARQAWRR